MIDNASKHSTSSSFLSQMIAFSAGPIFGAVFSFLSAIVIAWIIAPDELGKVSMFSTILSLLVMFSNLGLDRAYMREFSSTDNKDKLLYNCLSISVMVSIIVSIIVYVFRQSLSLFLFDQADPISVAVLSIVLPLSIFGEYSVYVCRLKNHIKNYTIAVLCENCSYFLYVLIMYTIGVENYKPIIIARLLSIVTKSLVAFILEKNSYHFYGWIDKDIAIKALRYGVPYMPSLICSWVLHSMDKYALRMWSTYSEIGFYSSAYTIVSILAILRSAFSSFWTPLAYKWYDQKKEVVYFEKVGHYLTTALICCSTAIVLLRNIIYHIYKPEYMTAANVVPFLLFVISMETISYVSGCGINLKKRTVFNLVATLASCAVNLVGNYLLVPRFGAIGASVATGLSSVAYMLLKTMISRKLWYKFPIFFYFTNVLLISLMSTLAIILNSTLVDIIFAVVILCFNAKNIVEIMIILKSFISKMLRKRDANT